MHAEKEADNKGSGTHSSDDEKEEEEETNVYLEPKRHVLCTQDIERYRKIDINRGRREVRI
jgi:hypothetical protein